MWLTHGTLKYYGGNYAKFVATVEEEERLQLKVYEKQQADMEKLEKFVEVHFTPAQPFTLAHALRAHDSPSARLTVSSPRVSGGPVSLKKQATAAEPLIT